MAFNFGETNFNIVVASPSSSSSHVRPCLVVGSVEFVIQCGTLTSSETKDFTGQTCSCRRSPADIEVRQMA